jgi:hypothetical protein
VNSANAQEDEKYVREALERAEACPRESKTSEGEEWAISLGGFYYTKHSTDWCESETAAWSAARAFTEERLEEIRQIERDIQFMTGEVSIDDILTMAKFNPAKPQVAVDWTREYCTVQRILARLIAIREELRRGMRP